MCRTGKILENSDSGAGGSGRGKLWQNKRKKKWKKKAWNVVIVTRRQHPALKKKKTITEPFKPYERTVKRYQPDAGREPLLR